ncbi:MAG: hypothetical protein IJ735_02485 [Clostridia bacterium]|nr:hypothetical protein [Clostridia bacterium]
MVVSIIVASVLAVAFMAARVTIGTRGVKGAIIAMFVKILASLGFIAIGVAALFSGVTNQKAAAFFLFGLVFGLIGDIVLDMKVVYLKQPEEGLYLSCGMVSFAIGHVMYLVGLIMLLGDKITLPTIGICVAVAALLAFGMVYGGEKILKFRFGKFAIHSLIYGFILIFMGALSIGVCITAGENKPVLFAVGMVLFFLSDAVLSMMYFGGRPRDKALSVINHSLYYAAQICIAAFLFFI